MNTGAPRMSRVITMVIFALSCVGLLLFLWLSFGGTIPLGAQGYRVNVSFANAQDLATQADVRIAGVSVGKVVSTRPDPHGNGTLATLQLQSGYSPLRSDTRAILRTKTILGETYVQLIPGAPNAPPIADGGTLPRSRVLPTVQLSDIFNALDPTTRHAFTVWQQSVQGDHRQRPEPQRRARQPAVVRGRRHRHPAGAGRPARVGHRPGPERRAPRFGVLGADETALRNLITSAETTFATTAANNNALAETFHVFPTFLTETKATTAKLQTFSGNTDPLVPRAGAGRRPAAKPTLASLQQLAPPLRRFFTNLGPLVTVSKTGLPAVSRFLTGAGPTLAATGTFLEQLNPILGWLSLHQQLISDFITQGGSAMAATTTSFAGNSPGHYLRQFQPTGPRDAVVRPQPRLQQPRQHLSAVAVACRPARVRQRQLSGVGLQEHRARATARNLPAVRVRRRRVERGVLGRAGAAGGVGAGPDAAHHGQVVSVEVVRQLRGFCSPGRSAPTAARPSSNDSASW